LIELGQSPGADRQGIEWPRPGRDAAGAGEFVDVGGDAFEHRREAVMVYPDDRALRVVDGRAQVGRRRVGAVAELGDPARAAA
jgi:hypothetical protein